MRLLLITKDLAENSTGRTYVLWLLARQLGWEVKVASERGAAVWAPVADGDFTADCSRLNRGDPGWEALARWAELIVAVKPLGPSFGPAMCLADDYERPLLLDVDDPDVEAALATGRPVVAAINMVFRPARFWSTLRVRSSIGDYPTMTSNPTLQRTYGGRLVPHARPDTGQGNAHTSADPTVAFVGTMRRHKGVGVLRQAAATAPGGPLQLTLTGKAPRSARPNERWIGTTTLSEGIDLVKRSDIVVVPSLAGYAYSAAQLPAKLIDAMIAARAVVVSDLEPLRWALGDTGLHVDPGDADALADRLGQLRDPALRRSLGHAARRRAIEMFTVSNVAHEFRRSCEQAVAGEELSETADPARR